MRKISNWGQIYDVQESSVLNSGFFKVF